MKNTFSVARFAKIVQIVLKRMSYLSVGIFKDKRVAQKIHTGAWTGWL